MPDIRDTLELNNNTNHYDSSDFKRSLEGVWSGVKALGDWFGIGTMFNRWINDAREDKYDYSTVLNKLEAELTKRAQINPTDFTKANQLINSLTSAVFSVSGPAARKFANWANNLNDEIARQTKVDNVKAAVKGSQVQEAQAYIDKARQKAQSGDIWAKEEMNDLISKAEKAIGGIENV